MRDAGYLPEGTDTTQERKIEALYRYLCDAPSLLLNVALVDAVGEKRIQNQPGTSDEYPNWRVPLADSEGRKQSKECIIQSVSVAKITQTACFTFAISSEWPMGFGAGGLVLSKRRGPDKMLR